MTIAAAARQFWIPCDVVVKCRTGSFARSPVSENCGGIQLHLGWQSQPRISDSAQRIHRKSSRRLLGLRAEGAKEGTVGQLRTCRLCRRQFDPSENHPRACRFHNAHFGGETARKFEGVNTGGTMTTVGGGTISQYWHCCGSTDPQDPGCEAAPHSTYDD